MTISNNKTSHLVSTQLPDFVREEHSTFVEFLEDYYKFLEQETGVMNITKNLLRYQDVDLSEGVFLQKLYDNFITLIPEDVLADKTLLLKHIKDFYRARGSEKSVRFLMRVLLNKEVSFYYPKRDILKASDGKWYVENSVRISDIKVDNVSSSSSYTNFASKTITGNTSGATAIVESIDVFYDKGQLVTELKVSNLYRTFSDGEIIWTRYVEEGVEKFISASLFSGVVTSISLTSGGSGYIEGATVPVEGGGGSGATVIISRTTKGSLSSIGVSYGGSGYQSNDAVIVTGGGGSGATANVLTVDTSGTYHPNSFNIAMSTIGLESGTAIGNARYSNLVSSIVDPANAWVTNSMSYWTYSNCGPVISCMVINSGNNYTSVPTLSVSGNTLIRSVGILGRLKINNGGLGYAVGDVLQFINPLGSYGYGASANVTAVNASGSITTVSYQRVAGLFIGGAGYTGDSLPAVNVASGTGTGANIVVTGIIGEGATVVSSTTSIGQIEELKLTSGGSGYTSVPTINLDNMSSGSGAAAEAFIVTGAYTYPGRYLNDDGFLSSYNFLQDRDYYQNYSYVIRVSESLNKYRKAIKDLIHPAGMKLFGEYVFIDANTTTMNLNTTPISTNSKMMQSTYYVNINDITKSGVYNVKTMVATYAPYIIPGTYAVSTNTSTTYTTNTNVIVVSYPNNTITEGRSIYLQFDSAAYSNIKNGYYTVSDSSPSSIIVPIQNGNSAFVQLAANQSNLTISTGSGANVSAANLSLWTQNSNVAISVGDSINVRGNIVTVVYKTAGSNTIMVYPPLRGNIVANLFSVIRAPFTAYGNVKLFDPLMTITANSTGLSADQNVYLQFRSSDTKLSNASYTVVSGNASVIKVSHKDIVNAASFSGNVNVHLRTVTLTYTGHGLSNTNNVYLQFYSGDTTNTVNNLYTIEGVTANTFNVTMANSVTTSGSVRILTNNVTINIAAHGFATNDSVYIWSTSGDTSNIANGRYGVNVFNSSAFSLLSSNIPTSNGNITVYRNYANVTINRTAHGFSLNGNVRAMFDTGNLANVPNGIFMINSVANVNTYNIIHRSIVISSDLNNLLANNSGVVYVSSK